MNAAPASTPAASLPAPIPMVAQIQILGLQRTSESEVLAMLEAREGQPYPADAESQDFGKLLSSGLFTAVSMKRVALSSAAIRLDIQLTEGAPQAEYRAAPAASAREDAERKLGAAEPDAVPTPPWVIGELEFRGNRNVKPGAIRSQVKGRKGDLYDRADLDRDIQAVLGLGNFDRVAADLSALKDRPLPPHFASVSGSPYPVRVVFMLEEKPLVGRIEFAGRQKISKGRLKDEMELKKKDPFDQVKVRRDTEKMLELYHKKGYHRATITPVVSIDTATLKADVLFRILEGPKAKIAEVRFTGAQAFKTKKIAKKLTVNRRKKVFSEKDLPEDLKKLETYYKNQGYVDFRIAHSSVTTSADLTKIYLDITLEEGRQYRYGDTTFSGHVLYTSTELAKALEYRKGKLFSQEKFDLSIAGIQELYAEKGRLRTQISPEKTVNDKTSLTDVNFFVTEGDPVYVDHVDVEGFKTTKGYVFRREVVIKPGMLFQASKIRKSQEKIMNLGFVDDVQLDVQSPYDPNKVDLTFEVVEGKPGMLTAGAGFSSLDGLIGTLSLQHLNLFGRGWRSSANWSFGSRVNDFSVSWTTPWIQDRPISLGFDVFNTRRISAYEGSSRAYTNKRTGGSIRVGPRFQDDKYQLSFRYSFQRIQTLDVQNQFSTSLTEGTSLQSSIGVDIARDTLDNVWDPTRGSRNSLGVTLAGGPVMGDINFLKPAISNSWNKTLFDVMDYPFVMTVGNRAGYVTQFGQTKVVPVFERYFVGGQDTLRGYSAFGEAGYRDGGKVYDVFNVEFGFPLARERRRTIVKFVMFYDLGGAWDNTRSVRFQVGQGEQDLKSDVGCGIRFTTPAFPIRLDWGYGFQHRPGESKYQINFGIGNLF